MGKICLECGEDTKEDYCTNPNCKDYQLATLRSLLEKALPVVRAVANGRCCVGLDGPTSVAHITLGQAQALLPEIKRAVGKEGGG